MTYAIHNLKSISKQEPAEGYRLARIIAKSGKDGSKPAKLGESLGVFVPALRDAQVQAIMLDPHGMEYLRGCLHEVQDALIKAKAIAGHKNVFDAAIDSGAILKYVSAVNETKRFSKESISTWFKDIMQPVLTERLEEKGYGNQVDKLCSQYLEQFQVLIGKNPSMSNAIKSGLIRALELLTDAEDCDNGVTVEIARRLSEVQEPTEMLAAI